MDSLETDAIRESNCVSNAEPMRGGFAIRLVFNKEGAVDSE
jgi:hypothetical protein